MDLSKLLPFIVGLAGVVLAYLLGSVPFGYIIGKLKGVDVRDVGSGNIGATNVFRSLGKGPGIATFALDFLKGVIAVSAVPLLAQFLCGGTSVDVVTIVHRLVCGVSVVVGHSFPVFLGFKGGKGVATGAGLVVGLAPLAAACAFGAWLVVFLLSRYVSLASIFAALVVSAASWFLYGKSGMLMPVMISILAALVIVRHISNIKRLINGKENRFSFSRGKKKEEEHK